MFLSAKLANVSATNTVHGQMTGQVSDMCELVTSVNELGTGGENINYRLGLGTG